MDDFDEISYELFFSDDGAERIIKVTGAPMTDVEFITALKSFCFDSERNICEDGENIIFDTDEHTERH